MFKLQTFNEAKWTAATRKQYLKDHPENFAGPDDTYPIRDAGDVGDAWDLAGHATDPDAIRTKVKSIAKRLGLSHGLPDTAKDDEQQESAASVVSEVRPRQKIATLPVCYLEYNARSLNGRIYPKATCDAIHASLLRNLANPKALPMTCFISHEAANNNVNTQLVGRVSGGSQEGGKFYALIDFADTSVARDQLGLVEGKYMRSISMRVQGVELKQDTGYDLPLVVPQEGAGNVELLGIDLTTRPGLMDTARIQQVLYESAVAAPYTESFSLDSVFIQSKEEAPMSIPLYLQVIAGMMTEAVTADRAAHQRIHDHLAGVMDSAVKECHGNESAGYMALKECQLDEAGRAIAQKHAVNIAAAHDEAAKACGMSCEGCYKEALGIPLDPDQDGDVDAELVIPDDDDGKESTRNPKKGPKNMMTEAEMLAALKAKGYSVAAPKTIEEQLGELKAQSEAQRLEIEALKSGPPQRQTLAAASQMTEGGYTPEPLYEEGEYLAGPLAPATWRSLANRRVPWPKDVDPKVALAELAPFMAFRLLDQEASAMGRELGSFIDAHERV